MSDSLFDQLLEFKWRDVSFPAASFEVDLHQDIAQHKYPGVDGANLEGTGRAPISFTADIPFFNGAVNGKNEKWGVLYPTTYRAFVAAMADRSTGKLQHPEFGLVECKPVDAKSVWTADRRDGCFVKASWLETEDSPVDTLAIFTSTSPITNVILAALDLDASLGPAMSLFPTLPKYEPTFADTMRSITAFTDQASLLSQRAAGRIDAIAYRIETLSASVEKLGSPQLWPMRQSLERLRAALPDVKALLGTNGQKIVFYVTPQATTLAGVASDVGVPVSALITLNRDLVREPIVPAQTIVRYYKKR